jgi:hypothetical protein
MPNTMLFLKYNDQPLIWALYLCEHTFDYFGEDFLGLCHVRIIAMMVLAGSNLLTQKAKRSSTFFTNRSAILLIIFGGCGIPVNEINKKQDELFLE